MGSSESFIIPIIIGILLLIVVYFIPMIVALMRNHRNKVSIIVVNILLGWTFIGWVIALVWSLTQPHEQTPIIVNTAQPINDLTAQKMHDLAKLRSDSLITEEEYQSKRAELLSNM